MRKEKARHDAKSKKIEYMQEKNKNHNPLKHFEEKMQTNKKGKETAQQCRICC